MSHPLQVFLRVLYTINSNPQYILAKSSSPISAITCGENSPTKEPTYARAPLKACLAAVCDSSPELLQDPARDFSLYFLDPLETEPLPTGLANETTSPRGVAVALGLMSWALESDDSANVFVTGTMVPNALPALEVICALRETKRMPKPTSHSYYSFGPTTAGPSQYLNPLYHPQIAGMNWLSASHFHHDQRQQRTLTRSADFPELYIGPPRRGRGRPEGSTSKSKAKISANTSVAPGESSSEAVETQFEPKPEKGSKQATKPRPPRPPPTDSPFICTPLARNIATAECDASQSRIQSHAELYSRAQQQPPSPNPLLGLLSAISSTDTTPEQHTALLSALQALLTANSHLLQSTATNVRVPANTEEERGTQERQDNNAGNIDDGDSDIVLLDSSTIDTTMFRKPNSRQQPTSDASLLAELPLLSGQGTKSLPRSASTPFSEVENTLASSRTSMPSGTREPVSTVTADSETPTSRRASSKWIENGSGGISCTLDVPATPTPSRTSKRKLDEYTQGQTSPPSPSPSVARTSNSGRALAAKDRVPSSPTSRMGPVSSSSSMRLPSMLDSMRGMGASGSRLQVSVLSSKAGHVRSTDVSALDASATSLKRRRTLTEFMAEHEARKNANARKQSSTRRKSGVDSSSNTSQAAPPRSTHLGSVSRHTQSSPPRPLFRSGSMVSAFPLPASSVHPGSLLGTIAPNFASSSTTAFPSTVSFPSTSTVLQEKNPLKNFVLPAWARTGTAMLPRLSKEALARQEAEREAKKAQTLLRRREAARAKRKRLHPTGHSKDSSDEDEAVILSGAKLRTYPSSSNTARSAPSSQAPLPSLPVFASDAVEPIPSSPPPSRHPVAPPVIPSTPPRKPVSSGLGPHRTPSKSGSCSLFTPSGQSLFTPSASSVTRTMTRTMFTPRSPTVLRHAGSVTKSPRKSLPQTPRRTSSSHPTPKSLRTNRHVSFASPGVVARMPLTQTGTRAFLLPPSPCASRTPRRPREALSKASGDSSPLAFGGSETPQTPAAGTPSQVSEHNEDSKEDVDMLSRELNEALLHENLAVAMSPSYPRESNDTTGDDVNGTEEEGTWTASPLPPSSPPLASPLSSPAKIEGDDASHGADTAGTDTHAADPLWLLSDDTAAWFTDSDGGAWLTETDAWLTDTDAAPSTRPTDSDGAWLSDSDAVSVPVSSNWFSDEDGDGDGGAFDIDAAAFQRAFENLVERSEIGGVVRTQLEGGEGADTRVQAPSPADINISESELWASMRPLLGGEAGEGAAPGLGQLDMQALLDGLVDNQR